MRIILVHVYIRNYSHTDDRFKDSAYVGLGGATSTDGEPKACEDLSDVMQINPSYGIIPRTPECKDEKAKTETTKVSNETPDRA